MRFTNKKVYSALMAVAFFVTGTALLGAVSLSQGVVITNTKNLTIGSSGTDVVNLQKVLEKEGYLALPAGVQKGYFGNVTKEALRKFQKANNITSTGIFGPRTRSFYNSQVNAQVKSEMNTQALIVSPTIESSQSSQSNNQNIKSSSTITANQVPSLEDNSSSPLPRGKEVVTGGASIDTAKAPSPHAVAACDPLDEGGVCTFTSDIIMVTGTCKEVKETLVCIQTPMTTPNSAGNACSGKVKGSSCILGSAESGICDSALNGHLLFCISKYPQ